MKDVDIHFSGALTSQAYPTLRNDLITALRSSELVRVHLWAVDQFDACSLKVLLDVRQIARTKPVQVDFVDTAPELKHAIQNAERTRVLPHWDDTRA